MLVANKNNIKRYARGLFGNEYSAEKEKELITFITKKSIKDYESKDYHKSFAIVFYLEEINKILNTFGVESFIFKDNESIEYCNAGDIYNLTIYFYKDKLRIGNIGTIMEKHY